VVFLLSKKKDEQSRDACVLEIAESLKKEKWEVNANLEGWKKPDKVGPYTPDVVAKKSGCLTRICQVATEDLFRVNEKEYWDIKKYCDEYDFQFYVIKDGKRVQVNPEDFRGKSKK
jgi:hypothetical protein